MYITAPPLPPASPPSSTALALTLALALALAFPFAASAAWLLAKPPNRFAAMTARAADLKLRLEGLRVFSSVISAPSAVVVSQV